jgi:hypothetical protein
MKIKDLPSDTQLGGVKVKTSNGTVGYWRSQWDKGVWLTESKGGSRIYPIFVNSLEECKEWEVLKD